MANAKSNSLVGMTILLEAKRPGSWDGGMVGDCEIGLGLWVLLGFVGFL